MTVYLLAGAAQDGDRIVGLVWAPLPYGPPRLSAQLGPHGCPWLPGGNGPPQGAA